MAVPLETRDALVPNMLLQPLVENAVRYGVAPLVEGGRIAIKSAVHADRLRIVIVNSGRRGEGRAEQERKWNRSRKHGGAPENALWDGFCILAGMA